RFDARRNFAEQLHPLAPHAGFFGPEAGNIAAGASETLHEALSHWIGNGYKHDGNGAGHLSCGDQRRRGIGHQNVGSTIEIFLGERLLPTAIPGGLTIFDCDVTTGRPSQFLDAPLQCRSLLLPFWIIGGSGHQPPDSPHPLALLRARREWPRRRAADERDELAPFHSITSSAPSNIDVGIVTPIALAV